MTGLRNTIQKLQSTLSQLTVQDSSRAHELTSLQGQLDDCHRQLESLSEERERREREMKQLKEEIGLMTRENQAVHEELRRALVDKADLTNRLEESSRNIIHYQEILFGKEQETVNLTQSNHEITTTAEELQSTLTQKLGEIAAALAEVAALTQMKENLEGVIEQQTAEIQQHIHSLSVMEQQLSHLTTSLAKMEVALRQEGEEKKALLSDLNATRELSLQLDKTKESLTRQLASQGIQIDQLNTKLGDLKSEKDLLKQQLVSERNTVESLQVMLSEERRKEYHISQTGEEKQLEIEHLRRKLSRLETDRYILYIVGGNNGGIYQGEKREGERKMERVRGKTMIE